jgi:hypothetical protein
MARPRGELESAAWERLIRQSRGLNEFDLGHGLVAAQLS